jgi:acyl-CoA reductase-like NAD-dependent aldehyde dehydrogenase
MGDIAVRRAKTRQALQDFDDEKRRLKIMQSTRMDVKEYSYSPTVNDEIHAPMGGVRDSGWGRTGPRSLDDFSDLIWINSHSGQRQYPF